MTDVHRGIEINKRNAKKIEAVVGMIGYQRYRRTGRLIRLKQGRLFLLSLLGRSYIVVDLIQVQQLRAEPEVILFFAPDRILAGIEPHGQVEIAVADPAFQRVDLKEVIETEFDIAADAVHPDGVLLQGARDIGDMDIGELKDGIVPQIGL